MREQEKLLPRRQMLGMVLGIGRLAITSSSIRAQTTGRALTPRINRFLTAVYVLAGVAVALTCLLWSVPTSAQSRGVSEVWALEDDYWRFVKAGDVESYVKLWHDKFIGWPCDQDHPKRKSSIGDWVREVRDNKIKVTLVLTREGAEDFGSVVIVHYRFTRVDEYPDGRVVGRNRESKITHTWQIIGGMCGGLAPAVK